MSRRSAPLQSGRGYPQSSLSTTSTTNPSPPQSSPPQRNCLPLRYDPLLPGRSSPADLCYSLPLPSRTVPLCLFASPFSPPCVFSSPSLPFPSLPPPPPSALRAALPICTTSAPFRIASTSRRRPFRLPSSPAQRCTARHNSDRPFVGGFLGSSSGASAVAERPRLTTTRPTRRLPTASQRLFHRAGCRKIHFSSFYTRRLIHPRRFAPPQSPWLPPRPTSSVSTTV